MTIFARTASAAFVAAAVLLSSTPAAARPVSIRDLAAQEVRLATIAHRIGAAGAASCRANEVLTGIVVHDLTRYDPRLRPAVSSAFSLTDGFGVLGVIPGSPAERAGLRVDDELLAVGTTSLKSSASLTAPKSYRRTDEFHAAMRDALRRGEGQLLIRRAGVTMRIAFQGQSGCGGVLALTNSPTLNAWSDGQHVVLTTGITGMARSDDELAFVIAHEMAHNILGHSETGDRRAFFGLARARQGELDADSLAVRLMADAGFHPAGGLTFLDHARRRLWWNFSLDHPGFSSRLRTVDVAMRKYARTASPCSRPVQRLEGITFRANVTTIQPTAVTASACKFNG